jgi:hypothetical protein
VSLGEEKVAGQEVAGSNLAGLHKRTGQQGRSRLTVYTLPAHVRTHLMLILHKFLASCHRPLTPLHPTRPPVSSTAVGRKVNTMALKIMDTLRAPRSSMRDREPAAARRGHHLMAVHGLEVRVEEEAGAGTGTRARGAARTPHNHQLCSRQVTAASPLEPTNLSCG